MTGARLRDSVLSQIDVWWFRFRLRLDGMTDDELWWQPAPGCFTLSRGEDGAFHYEWPPGSDQGLGAQDPPFTTLVWRLAHLSVAGLAGWALTFEARPNAAEEALALAFPEVAASAIRFVEEWFDRWRAAISLLDDDDLWRPLGESPIRTDIAAMFLGKEHPLVNHVLHQHRELIHHGAEVALLRDLYAARKGQV